MAAIDFFYEFASTYSYITAMRIAPLAQAAGVTVRWRPFLLGPIFKAQGWDTSPFNLYPAKGRYMVRDCERQARRSDRVPSARAVSAEHAARRARRDRRDGRRLGRGFLARRLSGSSSPSTATSARRR